MKRKPVTLCNDFHGTRITMMAAVGTHGDMSLSAYQVRQARKALCGIHDCTCAQDDLHQRGSRDCSGYAPWPGQGATLEFHR